MQPLIVHFGPLKYQESGENTILKELRKGKGRQVSSNSDKNVKIMEKRHYIFLVYLNTKLTFTSLTTWITITCPLKPQAFLKEKSNNSSFVFSL